MNIKFKPQNYSPLIKKIAIFISFLRAAALGVEQESWWAQPRSPSSISPGSTGYGMPPPGQPNPPLARALLTSSFWPALPLRSLIANYLVFFSPSQAGAKGVGITSTSLLPQVGWSNHPPSAKCFNQFMGVISPNSASAFLHSHRSQPCAKAIKTHLRVLPSQSTASL